MKLIDIINACNFEVIALPDENVEISAAYTSDLLSDVMGHCPDDSILITVQNHKNSVAVSTLVGVRAVVVVHNRDVPDDMISLSMQEGVALLRSCEDQFSVSCKVGGIIGGVEGNV